MNFDFSFLVEQHPIFFYTFLILFLLCVGSLLNVVIYRLPKMMEREWRQECELLLEKKAVELSPTFNLFLPRSHCPTCKQFISASNNIPILSFILQRGRCKHCHASISWHYPLVELGTVILGVCLMAYVGWNTAGFALTFLLCMLIALTVIDVQTQLLPDILTIPLIWIGLLLNTHDLFCTPTEAILGAVLGYMILWTFYIVFKCITGKEGMGHGDFKLLSVFGAWGGPFILPSAIMISSFLGSLFGIGLIFFKNKSTSQPFAFGPFLVIGGLIALLFGHELNHLYLQYAFGVK